MGRQGKVTGAEEKRATGKRGDRGKQTDRHLKVGRRSWWVQRETRGRGALMAVCRAGRWNMQGFVGAEGCVCL